MAPSGQTTAVAGAQRRRGPLWRVVCRPARSFSLYGKEFEQHIVALCLLIRTSEPRPSRLYGVDGSSLLGGIGADAIVKSSTNLQNSLSLNSRILAYAATMRSARTRASRSP
jgi:hypothetical protein